MNRIRFFVIIFLFISSKLAAQQYYTHNLEQLINQVKENEGINFSYDENVIKGKEIKSPHKNVSLPALIQYIKDLKFLNIKKVGNNYLIYPIENNDPAKFCLVFKDFYTKENIDDVIAQLANASFVHSNAKGEINFESKVNDTISAYKEGYEFLKIPLKSNFNNCTPIYLKETSTSLQEVVLVNNYLNSAVSKNKDGSLNIDYKSNAIFPGLVTNDVTESLQLLPGIYSPTESAADLNIRGGSDDQNLYLWDGIKLYQSGHFFDQFSLFNPFIIDHIKLIKNAPSASYQDVSSGIVDITTDQKIPKKPHFKAGVSFSNANVNVKIPVGKKISLLAAGRTSVNFFDVNNELIKDKVFQNTNLSQSLTNNGNVFNIDQKFDYYDVNAKLLYKPNKKTYLQISALSNEDNFNAVNTFINESDVFNELIFLQNNEDDFKTTNTGFSFTWEQEISSVLSHKLLGYSSSHQFNFDTSTVVESRNRGDSGNVDINDDIFSRSSNKIDDRLLSYSLNYRLSDLKSLQLGIHHNISELSYLEEDPENQLVNFRDIDLQNQINTTSFFTEFKFKNSVWDLNTGFRVNYFNELEEFNFTPRLSLSRKINRFLRLFSSIELKSQLIRKSFLTADSRFSSFREAWVIAGTSNGTTIPVYKGVQGALGATYAKKNIVVDIDFFIKNEDGLTFFDENELTNGLSTIHNGSGVTFGVDFYVKAQFRKLKSWLNYSYLNNRVSFPSFNTDINTLNNIIPHYLNWSNVLSLKKFDLGISYILRSGAPYSSPNIGFSEEGEPFFTYNAINTKQLPIYQRTDFSISHTIKEKRHPNFKVTYGLQLKNVFAQENIIKRSFGLTNLFENDVVFDTVDNVNIYQFDNVSRKMSTEFFLQVTF